MVQTVAVCMLNNTDWMNSAWMTLMPPLQEMSDDEPEELGKEQLAAIQRRIANALQPRETVRLRVYHARRHVLIYGLHFFHRLSSFLRTLVWMHNADPNAVMES